MSHIRKYNSKPLIRRAQYSQENEFEATSSLYCIFVYCFVMANYWMGFSHFSVNTDAHTVIYRCDIVVGKTRAMPQVVLYCKYLRVIHSYVLSMTCSYYCFCFLCYVLSPPLLNVSRNSIKQSVCARVCVRVFISRRLVWFTSNVRIDHQSDFHFSLKRLLVCSIETNIPKDIHRVSSASCKQLFELFVCCGAIFISISWISLYFILN